MKKSISKGRVKKCCLNKLANTDQQEGEMLDIRRVIGHKLEHRKHKYLII